ncbi:MAG TPA: hypothetical protein VGX94_01495 [Terriglobia bacterium]|nr:hypothetical protein [Terriglobia bacterium]
MEITSDPTPDLLGGDITNPQTLNRYAYAFYNPATNSDPFGLYPWALGNCLFDTVTASVNGQSQGSFTYFVGCLSVGGTADCIADGTEGCIPPPTGYPAGGGASPAPQPVPPRWAGGTNNSGTTVCGGPSVFTAVGPNQAYLPGSLSPAIFGHQAGGVAINPSIFGLTVGVKGTTAATIAYSKITAIAPQNLKLNGFPGPPYRVTDIGDPNVLNNVPFQFDVYGTLRGLPTTQQAKQFGRQSTAAYIAVDSPNFSCPAGYTEF